MKRASGLFLLLLLPVPGSTWWSPWTLEDSTHYKISGAAVNALPVAEYPDVRRFAGTIIGATSGPEDDANAHGKITDAEINYEGREDAIRFNGGDYEKWWYAVRLKYGRSKFVSGSYPAYYYAGLMAHLVEDQAVPAHSANILHNGSQEGVEKYAGLSSLGPSTATVKTFGKDPQAYYYERDYKEASIINGTQDKLPAWTSPTYGGRVFWKETAFPELYKYTGQAFWPRSDQGWGAYGGPGAMDIYPFENDTVYTVGIAQAQLNEAAAYSAGMLMAVSRSLPPIVTPVGISSSNIEPGKTVRITFDILENRTPGANVYLTLGGADGPAIISGEYKTGKYVALDVEYAADKLPWKKHLDIAWDGKLANGEYPKSGLNTLCVLVRDLDENHSEVSCVEFTIDTGGPRVSLGSAMGTIYVYYQGVGTASPAQSNPYIIETMGLALGVSDDSSGVKKIELRKIEQPDTEGIVVYSKEFDVPVGLFEERPLPALADGQYKLIAEDKDGNRTVAPFQLGSISVPEDKAASASAYNSSTGLLSVRLEVDATSYYDLVKLDLLDDVSGQLIESRSLSGKLSRQVFQLNDILALGNLGEYPDVTVKRRLRLTDVSGQVLERGEWFRVQENSIAVSGTSHEKASQTQDLLSLGLLPGALTTKKWPLWYSLGWKSDMSGGLVSYQPAGTVEIYMQTGDTPEAFALAQPALVARQSAYYRYFSAGAVVPDSCATPGVHDTDITDYCLSESISSVPVKRYVKFSAKAIDAQPTGILKRDCDQFQYDGSGNPIACLNGRMPGAVSLGDSLSPMLRGVNLSAWDSTFAGAGGARIEVGQNVSVRLTDLITVTFDNVTRPGFVSTAFVSLNDFPGIIPLTSFGIGLFDGAEYSGNIHFKVKYSGTFTEAQEAGIGVVQDVVDEMWNHSYVPLLSNLDTVNNELTFSATSLGQFLAAAPKYTTPFELRFPAEGAPEWRFISNNGGLTQRQITPGSAEETGILQTLSSRNLFPAGNFHYVGPDNTALSPAAVVTMKYDDSILAARGMREDDLGGYEFNADASVMLKLPNQWHDKVRNEIVAEVPNLHSIFAILGSSRGVPVQLNEDSVSPVTYAVTDIPPHSSGDIVFISTEALVFLDALDPKVDGQVTSGVHETYYVSDPVTENPTPLLYEQPLVFDSEGPHYLHYRSVDNKGNLELLKTVTYYADATPPASVAAIIGEGSFENGSIYVTEASSISLTAADSDASGPASGVGVIYIVISTYPCAGFSEYEQGPDICRPAVYSGPFALPPGSYYFYHAAMDNVGNMSAVKAVTFIVTPKDTEPPVTSITTGEPNYITEISTYVTGETAFTLLATDNYSGVKLTEFQVAGGSRTLYEAPFTLAQAYGIPETPAIPAGGAAYWNFDEGAGTTAADAAGVNHGRLINGPVWTSGKSGGALAFDGVDDYVEVPSAGSLNPGEVTVEAWINVAAHKDYNAVLVKGDDARENYELMGNAQGEYWFLVTSVAGGRQMVVAPPGAVTAGVWHHLAGTYSSGGELRIYLDGTLLESVEAGPGALQAGDAPLWLGNERGTAGRNFSGLIDEVVIYGRALTAEEVERRYLGVPAVKEGPHVISYRSIDKADNAEALKEQPVILDATPPATEFTLQGPQAFVEQAAEPVLLSGLLLAGPASYDLAGSTIPYVPEDGKVALSTEPARSAFASLAADSPAAKRLNFITSATELVFTAADAYSGVKEIRYAPGDGLPAAYAPPARITGADGLYTVRYQSLDQLGHLEVIKSSEVYLDNSAPVSQLRVGTGDAVYVSPSTLFTLTAADGEGSGVKKTVYRVEAGGYVGEETPYTAPFTLAAIPEGECTISYYSEDLLGNREVVKTQRVTLDITAPQTQAQAGEPNLELDGKVYITSRTELALLATDNLSGVSATFWKVDEKGWFGYEKPFTLSETPALPGGRAAYWNFDEGAGTTAADSSGANHGILINGPAWTSGKSGGALAFDGVDDYVAVASAEALKPGEVTVEAWINVNTHKNYNAVLVKGDDARESYELMGNALGEYWFLVTRADGGRDMVVTPPGAVTAGAWHHLAGTYSLAGELRFYLDGRLLESGEAGPGGLRSDDAPLWLGNERGTSGRNFSGLIDEAAVYGRALTQEEITRRYLGEAPPGGVADGEHVLYYYSIDHAGNKEPAGSRLLVVDSSGPAVITDVAAVAKTTHSITVAWSVPEDVGALGKVGQYAIGAATGPAGLSFENAKIVIAASPEESAGDPKAQVIENLEEGTAYYIAVWSLDGLGNASGISNTVSVKTDNFETSSDGVVGIISEGTEITAVLTSTGTEQPAFAVLSQAGLVMAVSAFYDLQPDDIVVEPPAELSFAFNPVEVDTATLAIYRFDGVSWSSAAVFDQKILYLSAESAVLTGYINHTSLYALLYTGDKLPPVSALSFSPDVLNLKSGGRYVEAVLSVTGGGGTGFDISSIRITGINDIALAAPIYAIEKPGDGDKQGGGSIRVKFDRQALIAALPVDRQVKVTVEGRFTDGTAFSAVDYLRVINPGRVVRKPGGKVRHQSGAGVDIPPGALKADADITVVALAERAEEWREREMRAGDSGLRLKGEPYEFGPEGAVFDEPVVISLPYEASENRKEELEIAYWDPSKKDWEPLASELDAGKKVVKAKVSHFSLYQVVASPSAAPPAAGRMMAAAVPQAGPSAEFVLGEVYVYPNPALRGAAPTLHIEVGVADRVKITIYTVSGRRAHETTLTGMPAALDDGDGLAYAYEYAWRGDIPSGVYYYSIEAEKGGQKLRKSGKFAVVR